MECVQYCVLYRRFDVDWLKNRAHHTHQGITSDSNLSEKERKYLLAIHTRHNGCARDPSPKDIEILEVAYKLG